MSSTLIAFMLLALVGFFTSRSHVLDPVSVIVLIFFVMIVGVVAVIAMGVVFLVVAAGFLVAGVWTALVALKTTALKNLTRSRTDER